MTQPGLIRGLPGGTDPLLDPTDPRLIDLLDRTRAKSDELLAQIEESQKHKVGIVFETLVQWGLVHGLGYRVLGRDIQINSDVRTLGALDLVLQAPEGQVEHWELAYKLYLQRTPAPDWEHWVGPAERDRLDIKLEFSAVLSK